MGNVLKPQLGYSPSFNNFFTKLLYLTSVDSVNQHSKPLRYVSHSEVYYTLLTKDLKSINTFKYLGLTNKDYFSFFKIKFYPLFFDLNLEKSLLNSKEQRWLVKNSLLTEFMVSNSYSLTQSKQLMGVLPYNSNFSIQNLWLSTKLFSSSSVESIMYANKWSNFSYPTYTFLNSINFSFCKNFNNNYSNFINLNFFENSRLWLFKKYFFNNQQSQNLILDTPLVRKNGVDNNFSYSLYKYSLTNVYINSVSKLESYYLISSFRNNVPGSLGYGLGNNTPSNIYIHSPVSDIYSSLDSNFFLFLTSNVQPYHKALNYFSVVDYGKLGSFIDSGGVEFRL
jgi:hypothetical protein